MNQLVVHRQTEVLSVHASPQDVVRVRDLDFADLYLNENGLAELQGSPQAPLVQIPINAVFDLSVLMTKAFQCAFEEQDFQVEHDGIRYRGSRITNVNRQDGRTLVLRRLKDTVPRLNELNLPLQVMRALGFIASKTHGRGEGLILVCGSTGSGKTTTISSILQEYLLKIGGIGRTIEDPPEYPLEGSYPPHGRCWQTKVVGGDFFTPLKEVLRNGPKYILFGEIRDHKSAGDLLRAAQTGHIVLSTIHAANIPEALTALVQLVAADLNREFAQALLASSVAAVLSQRLVSQKMQDGTVQRHPMVESLFFPTPDGGPNSIVRGGNFHQLASAIDAQNSLIRQNREPFPMRKQS